MYLCIVPFVFARSFGNIPPQITCDVFPQTYFFYCSACILSAVQSTSAAQHTCTF